MITVCNKACDSKGKLCMAKNKMAPKPDPWNYDLCWWCWWWRINMQRRFRYTLSACLFLQSITLKYLIKDHVRLLSLEFSSSMVPYFPAWSFILKNFFLVCSFITSCSFIIMLKIIHYFVCLLLFIEQIVCNFEIAGALFAAGWSPLGWGPF